MTPIEKLKAMCQPSWDDVAGRQPVSRLWQRDHTLWKPDPTEISNRLGWLDLPKTMMPAVDELNAFAEEARGRGFKDVMLLGMGGSSLCAEVMRRVFGSREGFPELHVLDSTMPHWVQRVTSSIDPAETLFLVCSKSGSTVEVLTLYRHFRGLVERAKGKDAGANFVAITDEGTPLQRMAGENNFLRAFLNPPDVGGRYSGLSYFGLVPAALMGIDTRRLLSSGEEMARACEAESPLEENPGARLGLIAGCLANNGRDKLAIVTSPSLSSFSLWAEQLVAESTGKEGKGIIPIAEEPFGPPDVYGDDRLFVYLRLAGDDNTACDGHVQQLETAGHPVLKVQLRDKYDLGGEFFRWEFAIAVAGACLGVNPFEQPNVAESKANTRDVLARYETDGSLPELADESRFDELLSSARAGDYLALMAFVDDTAEAAEAFATLRRHLLLKRRLPTTFGYGPRFLHSTGQLHKGGPDKGLFVQVTCGASEEMAIPGFPYGFRTLAAAQAIGDFLSLKAHGRRVIRLHVENNEELVPRVARLADGL